MRARALTILGLVLGTVCALFAVAADASGIWLDVPFVKQQKEGCGSASIAMIMQYWQQHGQPETSAADAGQIQQALHDDSARGVYASEMEKYFQRNGYSTFAFTGEWSDLQKHLENGRPLIASLKPGAGQPMHYVVVAGLDPSEKVVLLNDPAQRKLLKEDRARFEQEWKAAGNWTLLAVPKSSSH